MSKTLTSRQYLKQLNILFFAQAGVMLTFAGVVYVLVSWGKILPEANEALTGTMTYALIALIVVCFSSAHFVYQFIVNKIDHTLPLQKKTPKYLAALLVRSALLELPGLFAVIVFFLTGNLYLLLIPLFVAIIFFLLRPTAENIAEDMKLNPEEAAQLKEPDAIVADASKND